MAARGVSKPLAGYRIMVGAVPVDLSIGGSRNIGDGLMRGRRPEPPVEIKLLRCVVIIVGIRVPGTVRSMVITEPGLSMIVGKIAGSPSGRVQAHRSTDRQSPGD